MRQSVLVHTAYMLLLSSELCKIVNLWIFGWGADHCRWLFPSINDAMWWTSICFAWFHLQCIDCTFIMGFEPLVNQRLLPPTFPRYTKIRSRVDTMEYLDGMMTRLVQICSITQFTSLHDILVSYVFACTDYSLLTTLLAFRLARCISSFIEWEDETHR